MKLPGHPGVFWAMLAVVLLAEFANASFFVVESATAYTGVASNAAVADLLESISVSMCLLYVLGGWLAGRLGTLAVTTAGAVFMLTAMFIRVFAPDAPAATHVALILLAVGDALFYPGAFLIVGNLHDAAHRFHARAFILLVMAQDLGFHLAVPVCRAMSDVLASLPEPRIDPSAGGMTLAVVILVCCLPMIRSRLARTRARPHRPQVVRWPTLLAAVMLLVACVTACQRIVRPTAEYIFLVFEWTLGAVKDQELRTAIATTSTIAMQVSIPGMLLVILWAFGRRRPSPWFTAGFATLPAILFCLATWRRFASDDPVASLDFSAVTWVMIPFALERAAHILLVAGISSLICQAVAPRWRGLAMGSFLGGVGLVMHVTWSEMTFTDPSRVLSVVTAIGAGASAVLVAVLVRARRNAAARTTEPRTQCLVEQRADEAR